jgi:hypothetical protein
MNKKSAFTAVKDLRKKMDLLMEFNALNVPFATNNF